MMYECSILPGFRTQEIEAESAEEARKMFVAMVVENLDAEHVTANNLDTEDGEDPSAE